MIRPGDIRRAAYVIDESDVVNTLLNARRRDSRGRKTDPTNYRLFFIGGLLCIQEHGNFVIDAIHKTLTDDISLHEQFELGVRRWKKRKDGTEYVDILSVHDLYNVSKTLSSGLAYGHGAAPDLDAEDRARRHGGIRNASDALLDVCNLGFDVRTQAIDASGLWAWGKGVYRGTKDYCRDTNAEVDRVA